ncbi:hypothetical protein L6R53_33715, partial [Myxococcota bacterium]|nr:hypothetical protein [Myxococcota bacterium]
MLAQREDTSLERAAAILRRTGSWRTVFLTADRCGGADVDQGFENALIAGLEPYRLAGQDLEVEAPRYVPLELALTVCVKPEHQRSHVEAALRAQLGSRLLPDGRRGVFHPDRLSFGQTLYLSPLQAAAPVPVSKPAPAPSVAAAPDQPVLASVPAPAMATAASAPVVAVAASPAMQSAVKASAPIAASGPRPRPVAAAAPAEEP